MTELLPLRVLVVNEQEDRIAPITALVTGLGHEVIAGSADVLGVEDLTSREHPDVALVALGLSSSHALELIEQIGRKADCPVIAVLEDRDPDLVDEAAKCGAFAYIVDSSPENIQSALNIACRRFADYHNLQGAFGRRAQTERAKGILMERNQIAEDQAFEMLRNYARQHGHTLVLVAQAVLDGHLLLSPRPSERPMKGPPTPADSLGARGPAAPRGS